MDILQTGAWLLEDSTRLAPPIDEFLANGDLPVYFGFGSMPAREGVSRILVDAARSVGRRSILSRGWAELVLLDDKPELHCGRRRQPPALFPRVAVVVHHGGAGTTAAAARAGVPQVVVPMSSDQFYWASRVRALGIGASVAGPLANEELLAALREALEPEAARRARRLAQELRSDGAAVAARHLLTL